jgi:nucleotide-binding universal stress UspA family protein
MNIDHSNILIAVDDSQPSAWASEVGVALARRMNGSITLVHVVPPPTAGVSEGALVIVEDLADSIKAEGARVLEAAARRLPDDVRVRTVLRQGPNGLEIVAQAREMGADFIVMGSRGAGRLSHFILGSTAEAVIRQSPCPVVTVSHDPSLARTVATGAVQIEQRAAAVGERTPVTS